MNKAILEALHNRNLSDAVSAYETWAAECQSAHPDEDAIVGQMAILGIGVRDSESPDDALRFMLRLWKTSKNRRLCLEILVIITRMRWSPMEFRGVLETMPHSLLADKHIRLFVAKGYELLGEFSLASSTIKDVTAQDVQEIPSFRQIRQQLILTLIQYATRITSDLSSAVGISSNTLGNAIEEILSLELTKSQSADESWFIIRDAVFSKNASFRIPEATMINALTSRNSSLPLKTLGLQLALACGKKVLSQGLVGELRGTAMESNPIYLKSLFRFSDLSEDRSVHEEAVFLTERLANEFGPAGREMPTGRAETQVSELFGRLGAIKPEMASPASLPRTTKQPKAISEKKHIFIGVFGQLRFAHLVLPGLKSYINSELSGLSAEDHEVSYGLSTWNKAGQRHLRLGDPANFLLDLMPLDVTNVLLKVGVSTVSDIGIYLPSTTDHFIVQQGDNGVVTPEFIESLFSGDKVHTSISEDSDFVAGPGAKWNERHKGVVDLLNQGRMWNRLAAMRSLVEKAEEEKNAPVTHTIFLRSDLIFTKGSIGKLLTHGFDKAVSNWAFVDDDAHANFIEGLGDRYIVSDRIASDRLMEGEQLMQAVMQKDSTLFPRYGRRIGAHQWLDTLLFEHDTVVTRVPRSDVGFHIYRGRRELRDLHDQLAIDIQNSDHIAIKALAPILLKNVS